MFLAGLQQFKVITDHAPLVPIINSHRLDEIENPRLQRLCEKIMGYNMMAEWRKGKDNDAADALSRFPLQNESSTSADNEDNAELEVQINKLIG